MSDPCAALVDARDPDRFAATMAAPVAVRGRLWPIYAFNLEVARAAWASAEPMVAQMRLQWWRDGLAQVDAAGVVPVHDVLTPLAGVIAQQALPVGLFDDMVVARYWDIGRAGFGDGAAFDRHLQATAGNLMWLAALALGAGRQAEPVVRRFAQGAGIATWLMAVPVLVARGRLPLVDGSDSAVADLARQGLAALAGARAARHLVSRDAVPALLTGWQAGRLLRQVAAEPGRVAAGTMGQSEFARRGGLLWRGVISRW